MFNSGMTNDLTLRESIMHLDLEELMHSLLAEAHLSILIPK